MITTMMSSLHQWLRQRKPTFPFQQISDTNIILQHLHIAFIQQNNIGYNNYLQGRLSKSWYLAHDLYFFNRRLPESFKS